MKLATWNVNSLKVRQQHVIDWLELSQADVLCLQELKMPDEKFPHAELAAKGYRSWCAGQKTYNGVGILVRDGVEVDETDIVRNIPGFADEQQRVIAATVGGVRIVSAYFPNGQAPGSEKFGKVESAILCARPIPDSSMPPHQTGMPAFSHTS